MTKAQNKMLKEVMLQVSAASSGSMPMTKIMSVDLERWRDAQDTHWFPGEPNDYGGKEDCAMARFASKKDSGWNDVLRI